MISFDKGYFLKMNGIFTWIYLKTKHKRKNEMNHGNQETTPSKQILESTFE